jgi:hypothetical protein
LKPAGIAPSYRVAAAFMATRSPSNGSPNARTWQLYERVVKFEDPYLYLFSGFAPVILTLGRWRLVDIQISGLEVRDELRLITQEPEEPKN